MRQNRVVGRTESEAEQSCSLWLLGRRERERKTEGKKLDGVGTGGEGERGHSFKSNLPPPLQPLSGHIHF